MCLTLYPKKARDATINLIVIVAIEGTPIHEFDSLVACLVNNTTVGQAVTLTLLRAGQATTVEVTLGTPPAGLSR